MHVYKMVRNGVEYAPRTIAKAVSMEDGTSLDVALSKAQSPYGGVTTSVGNAYSIASPVINELKEGMSVRVKINNDSTGASTLDWNGKGAKGLKKANGTDVTNLKAGGIYTWVYDGVNFILQGEGASGNATASDLLSGKTATTDVGEIVGTMVDRGTVSTDITTKAQQVTIAAGKHSGSGIVKISATEQAKIIAGNIKSGVTLLGQAGGFSGNFYTGSWQPSSGDLNIGFRPKLVMGINPSDFTTFFINDTGTSGIYGWVMKASPVNPANGSRDLGSIMTNYINATGITKITSLKCYGNWAGDYAGLTFNIFACG